MTAPGFVPRPDRTVVDRIAKIEARQRVMQQATAGATTATGGVLLSTTPPVPIGPLLMVGAGTTSARSDHAHTSNLADQRDVIIGGATAGQGLTYDGTEWTNTDPPGTGMYSRYKATTASITTTYGALVWGSPVEGTGAGLTVSGGITFILGAGIWRVMLAVVAASSTTGVTIQLADSAVHASIATFYGEAGAPVLASQASAYVAADIRSTGSTPVVAWAVANTASGALTASGGRPRLSFAWSPL